MIQLTCRLGQVVFFGSALIGRPIFFCKGGDEMYSLNPKGGFSPQVGLRFSKETYEKMKEVCAKKEISVSVFIRMAVLEYLKKSA